jgi:hypothetical protein
MKKILTRKQRSNADNTSKHLPRTLTRECLGSVNGGENIVFDYKSSWA